MSSSNHYCDDFGSKPEPISRIAAGQFAAEPVHRGTKAIHLALLFVSSTNQGEFAVVYVSMTGFRPKGIKQLPLFWWRTIQSIRQARRAPGNLAVAARIVDGIYHTMTAWSDEQSMRSFVASGAHLAAMKNFRTLGTGWTYGCSQDELPDWDTTYRLWKLHRRQV